jgi:diguanylate cyclase (GGDEF)-like protein
MKNTVDFTREETFSGLIIAAKNFQFPLLYDRVLTFGRHSDNIIIIRHNTISRRHAKILFDGTHFRIDDLKSTNKTFVNGQDIQSAFIKSGDEIKIGEVVFRVKGELKPPPAKEMEQIEDPGMTSIIDMDLEKLRENVNSEEDQNLVDKFRERLLKERKHLQDLAFKDGLTGVYNRRYFDIELPRMMKLAQRYGHPLTLVMIDIDYFKRLNDTYGHQVGDDVLKWIGAAIRGAIRDTDIAARYGGEEFAIILSETDQVAASKVAEKMRALIEERSKSSFNIVITISVGIAELRSTHGNAKELIGEADSALYVSKQSGRNKIIVHVP